MGPTPSRPRKKLTRARLAERLEALYQKYNRRSFVAPDPLAFLYGYPRAADREVAGLIASCLAYGRVSMIMTTVASVLDKLGPDLAAAVRKITPARLDRLFNGFRYRFASQAHLAALILGIREILHQYGSVESCFLAGARDREGRWDVHQGLARIHGLVNGQAGAGHLLADPGKSSACKRSHLFLRWMVRQDRVDPGGWDQVPPACLVVPVDTHMFRIGSHLGFTRRRAADKRCAMEITRGFARLAPEDPVRYDFALTRFGIRREFDMKDLEAYLSGKDQ